MIFTDGTQTDATQSGTFAKQGKWENEVYASQMAQTGQSGYSGMLESKARLVDSSRKPRKSSEVWTLN